MISLYSKFFGQNILAAGITVVLYLITPLLSSAQQQSLGNSYVFSGGQMSIFGKHNLAKAINGGLPGIIGTKRAKPYGVLNFQNGSSCTGASNNVHVDGYVRKYGTTKFIFPVGDNGFYGPFAASGNGTTGAYYHVNPSSAITSDLGGGNYLALPTGGPFPITTKDVGLSKVSSVEYWDIDGTVGTQISLTWDSESLISAMTSKLSNLTIAGWNGSKWVIIASVIDVTSILGGTSNLTAGSITSVSTIMPDNYTAYTLAAVVDPLPVTLIDFVAETENASAVLKWSTADETKSDRFEIERSQDGNDWKKIGIIKSVGESRKKLNYSFTDSKPFQGENLYRLKMVDTDNAFSYSRIRDLFFDHDNLEMSVYPNPVHNKLKIQFTDGSKCDQSSGIKINNILGLDEIGHFKISNGDIDLSRLSAGIYTISITHSSGRIFKSKFVISR